MSTPGQQSAALFDATGDLIGFDTSSNRQTLTGGFGAQLNKDTIAAAGSTQATATLLTAVLNNVTAASAGQGVALPPARANNQIAVQNFSTVPIILYTMPGTTDTINNFAGSSGVILNPGTVADLNCVTSGAWQVQTASPVDAAYNTNAAAGAVTLSAANLTGATGLVVLNMTSIAGASNWQVPTASAFIAALHCPAVGQSYNIRIMNTGGAFTGTVTTNTGFTLNGTMTIGQNQYRDFVVTVTGATAVTLQSVGLVALAGGV